MNKNDTTPIIETITLKGVTYNILDSTAARLEDIPDGEVNLTLSNNSVSDGTTTFEVVANDLTVVASNDMDKLKVGGVNYNIVPKYAPHYYNNVVGTAAKTSSPYCCAIYDITDPNITELYDGLTIVIKIPVDMHEFYGTGIRINSNSLQDIHPTASILNSTPYANDYPVNSEVELIYNSTQSKTIYLNSNTSTSVVGTWKFLNARNSKITTGTSNSTSKLYLVGGTSLSDYIVTNSNSQVYMQDGDLTTKSISVGNNACKIQYENESIKFTFN